MAVDPGFEGMPSYAKSVWKVARARKMLDDFGLDHVELQVDGGIKAANIAEYTTAGATAYVAGSDVFNDKESEAVTIATLREQL